MRTTLLPRSCLLWWHRCIRLRCVWSRISVILISGLSSKYLYFLDSLNWSLPNLSSRRLQSQVPFPWPRQERRALDDADLTILLSFSSSSSNQSLLEKSTTSHYTFNRHVVWLLFWRSLLSVSYVMTSSCVFSLSFLSLDSFKAVSKYITSGTQFVWHLSTRSRCFMSEFFFFFALSDYSDYFSSPSCPSENAKIISVFWWKTQNCSRSVPAWSLIDDMWEGNRSARVAPAVPIILETG